MVESCVHYRESCVYTCTQEGYNEISLYFSVTRHKHTNRNSSNNRELDTNIIDLYFTTFL